MNCRRWRYRRWRRRHVADGWQNHPPATPLVVSWPSHHGWCMSLTVGSISIFVHGTSTGGEIEIVAGLGSGKGGAVTITTGVGTATDSGAMTLSTAAGGTSGNSGDVSMKTGAGGTTGNSGKMELATGDSQTAGASGNISISTGSATWRQRRRHHDEGGRWQGWRRHVMIGIRPCVV